jgi:hypothetical protein
MSRFALFLAILLALVNSQCSQNHKNQAKLIQWPTLYNISWNQTDFEQGVSYDGLQIATENLQQLTCDVIVVDLKWNDGSVANSIQRNPFPTPPGSYPLVYGPPGHTFAAVGPLQTNMHASLHAQGQPPGNDQMDFPQQITVHARIPIDHVVVPTSVVGGKPFIISVFITDQSPSYLTRIDVKWTDPKGLIVPDNQPINVPSGLYEAKITVRTNPTHQNENAKVTISTAPDNPITKNIKITSH